MGPSITFYWAPVHVGAPGSQKLLHCSCFLVFIILYYSLYILKIVLCYNPLNHLKVNGFLVQDLIRPSKLPDLIHQFNNLSLYHHGFVLTPWLFGTFLN